MGNVKEKGAYYQPSYHDYLFEISFKVKSIIIILFL